MFYTKNIKKFHRKTKYECSCITHACRCKRRHPLKTYKCIICYTIFPGNEHNICSKECYDKVKRYRCSSCHKETLRPINYPAPDYCSFGCRKKGRPSKQIDRLEVYDFFDHTCFLCDEFIDINMKPGLPYSPTLDHVVPKVHGGSNDWFNLVPSHGICNHRKSDKIDNDLIIKLQERLYSVNRKMVLF